MRLDFQGQEVKIKFFHYFILIVITTFCSCNKKKVNHLELIIDKELIQTPSGRLWKDFEFSTFSLDTSITSSLNHPAHLRYHDKYLYVMDASDQFIKRFNEYGVFVDTIGNGRGRGPGEFLSFTDLDFSSNHIWVSDVNKRELTSFDYEGNLINSFNYKRGTFRVASSEDEVFLLTLGDSLLISKYDFNGKLISKFGEFINNQRLNTMSMSGRIFYVPELNELAYLLHKASYLFYFSPMGDLIRAVELIDKQKFHNTSPKIIENNMIQAKSPRTETEISDWAIFEGKLFLKGLIRTGSEFTDRIDFIDVYSLDGSTYLYSVKVPYIFHSFAIKENILYFISLPTQEVKAISLEIN